MINITYRDVSIYVSSSDKFEWLWPGFFYYFDRFWPDCPYLKYLGTESKNYCEKTAITLKSGTSKSWGDVTIKNLAKIKTKYILFLLDDYFIQKSVDNAVMQRILVITEKIGAKYVKLTENHQKETISLSEVSSSFLPIEKSDIFGTPLQAAIWNREFFLHLLKSDESPWDFERNVKSRLEGYRDIYLLKKPALDINFGGVMHHGLIERKFLKRLLIDGVKIDLDHIMTRRQQTAKNMEDIMNDYGLQKILPSYLRKLAKKLLGVY